MSGINVNYLRVSVTNRCNLRCVYCNPRGNDGFAYDREILSLLAFESIEKVSRQGVEVSSGDFAENLTVETLDLSALRVGHRLRIGDSAELEVTQRGKHCHGRCVIFERLGDCVMPRDGVFARVRRSGHIAVGDVIEAIDD